MILTGERIAETARQIEVTANRKGWDRPPYLFALLGDGSRFVRQMVMADSAFTRMFAADARHALEQLAAAFQQSDEDLADTPAGDMIGGIAVKDFAGMGFVAEAYSSTVHPDERDGRRIADLPGATEIRQVHIADTAGRLTSVSRTRGEEATYAQCLATDDPDSIHGGPMIDSLRVVAYQVARRAPAGYADLPEMARAWPSAQDLADQVGVRPVDDAGADCIQRDLSP